METLRRLAGVLALLLVLFVSGCGDSGVGSPNSAAGTTDGRQGYVDAGASAELNILILKLKVWLQIRDVDILVVKAVDWARRQVHYLLNGKAYIWNLTEEQAK